MKTQAFAKVLSNEEISPGHFRIALAAPDIAARLEPGQFVTVRVTRDLQPLLRRPFSISRALPDNAGIEIVYRVVGRGTEILSKIKPNEKLDIAGPHGRPFRIDGNSGKHVIVAGGIGIAPFPGLVDSMLEMGIKKEDIILAYGACTEDELLLTGQFKGTGITCEYSTDDGTCGRKGFVTDLVMDHLTTGTVVYACGPQGMLAALAPILDKKNVPYQFSLEARMACGIGACMGCVVRTADPDGVEKYSQVCTEGPVFNSSETRLTGRS